jgi:H+/Cl- antiporter ClcA
MDDKSEFHTRDRLLMFAFALGPMSALTHLTVSYALVPESCAQGSKTMLHVSAAVFVALAVIGAFIGWHYHRVFADVEGVLWKERTRWVSKVVMVLSIFSAVVILAMELANVILRSCD